MRGEAIERQTSVGAGFITVIPTIASHFTPALRFNSCGDRAASQQMSELSVHLGCGLQSRANRATVAAALRLLQRRLTGRRPQAPR